jgi:predicted RNA-binding Zn-ribbon protein involved in translation (DUF1610 family)
MEILIVIGIIIIFAVLGSFAENSGTSGSTYTTTSISKNCSACGKSVSNSSAAGQRCPHCGAYWSSENTRYI